MRHQSSKQLNIAELLSKPTWSVRSCLPTEEQLEMTDEITLDELNHLMRLSALPPFPDKHGKEAADKIKEMTKTLRTQLHFVRQVQEVDTTGVEPLVAIRDETEEGRREATIGLRNATIKEALKKEEFKGRTLRPRRKRDVVVDTSGAEDWDVLSTANKTVGRYFVVNSTNTLSILRPAKGVPRQPELQEEIDQPEEQESDQRAKNDQPE